MEFVDEMEFERLGVFAYSPEENTPAASMPDQIPEEVKEERRDAILELSAGDRFLIKQPIWSDVPYMP